MDDVDISEYLLQRQAERQRKREQQLAIRAEKKRNRDWIVYRRRGRLAHDVTKPLPKDPSV